MNEDEIEEQGQLVLAAEECSDELFPLLHKFASFEERIIRSLVAHGPVLLRGGRGSGKSTLMREAANRLHTADSKAFGIYQSLRYLPLLRESGAAYEAFFCRILSEVIAEELTKQGYSNVDFPKVDNGGDLQRALSHLAGALNKRIVLLFDDAAHLGRESASSEFFDLFRSISSRSVSCKASIYPGVTNFGRRFDVYNDATVIDLTRGETPAELAEFFSQVMLARYPNLVSHFSTALKITDVSAFLGKAVLGNMRAFVYACNRLSQVEGSIGMPELTKCLIDLCASYFWPLLEEVEPKLGRYEPLVETSRSIGTVIFRVCGESKSPSIIIPREVYQHFAKPFEILEYAGFLVKREASRALKKGGRGPRYSVNLANLLESSSGARLTQELFRQWLQLDRDDVAEIQKSNNLFDDIKMPDLPDIKELEILSYSIDSLRKGLAYPYGLTPRRLEVLKEAGYQTIGDIAEASDEELTSLPLIKEATLHRIRSVLAQAIWM